MNRYLIIFLIVCALGVGAVLVYAKNYIKSPKQDSLTQQLSKFTAPTTPSQQAAVPSPAVSAGPTEAITELRIKDVKVGTGSAVKSGDTVEVNYVGAFLDGKKFDSSADHGQTFTFKVGAGQVIQGWDLGLVNMRVGGIRDLVVPADLAYGASGNAGVIPPNTPLIFEISLVSIKPAQ